MKVKLAAGEVVSMSAGRCVAMAVAEPSEVAGNWLFSRWTGGARWDGSVIVVGLRQEIYDYDVG